ncbi:hypothetical protein C5167_017139 [Papaver somniferum]|uniref:Uncharacterized protein n=1 Tax=Papaver somniferum TaxID=3469 RepID=A0A4Y7ILV4_PAPSO|nr:uncharacterized protein LOC113352976 [Papaver somniferum]RZC48711.1 hypothetical protein C5167_017139 [Papaver somniferum]
MSQIIEEVRSKAVVYTGDEIGQEKCKFVLTEVGLPNGLLPLRDIIECGHVEETGFVWLKQKKKTEHRFEKVGSLVSYASEVTAYVEKNRIRKLTGVKARELLLWVTLTEIYVDDPPTGKITFKSSLGLSKQQPTAAFQIEDVKEDAKGVKEVKEMKEEVKA